MKTFGKVVRYISLSPAIAVVYLFLTVLATITIVLYIAAALGVLAEWICDGLYESSRYAHRFNDGLQGVAIDHN